MSNTFHEVYYDVERAIDYAFQGQFVLKFYDYLKIRGAKKVEVEEFIGSATASEINNLVMKVMVTYQNQKQEKLEIICMAS
jgi:hypothetical protein